MVFTYNKGQEERGLLKNPLFNGLNSKYLQEWKTIETLRPNLNPYKDWSKVQELKSGLAARFYRSLYSACSILLGRNNPLCRKVLNSYNRCIEPSHK